MTNKEVVEKLQDHFLTQDPKTVARLCANLFIDLNRFLNLHKLTHEQKLDLMFRVKINIDEIHKFMKEGKSGDELILHSMDEGLEDVDIC